MGILSSIRGWVTRMYEAVADKLRARAIRDFKVTPLTTAQVDQVITECGQIYTWNPPWVDKDDHITTINFAATLCQEMARLITLAIGIKVDGSARAQWMQQEIDDNYFQLRYWVEYMCSYGTIILKYDGNEVNALTPNSFLATDTDHGRITGAVFKDEAKEKDLYYTRLEYQRFEDGKYCISNRAYVSKSANVIGEPCELTSSPWADLEPETSLDWVEHPLFAVLRMPSANNVEVNSPYGMPAFSNCIEELKALDIAYSRNIKEIIDSKRTVIIDSDKLFMSGQPIRDSSNFGERTKQLGLPDYVKPVSAGSSRESLYQEINPTLNTEQRITGINHLLSQIGFKAGFSNGYFVMDQKTGMMTATQVEADDRRTIQTIKDCRDKLEEGIDQLLYAMDVFATLYDLAPEGPYEVTYDFGDIDYNLEEDRARWWGYVLQGAVPKWAYFVKFEGMSEEEAKAMTAEAEPKQPTLFGEE